MITALIITAVIVALYFMLACCKVAGMADDATDRMFEKTMREKE